MSDRITDLDRLIQSGRATDEQIVERLVDVFYADLYHLSISILRGADEAEDATQETLIAAVTHLHKCQPGTNLKAWLYTIAVNTSRGFLRKRGSQRILRSRLQELLSQGERLPTPEQTALQSEQDAQLWGAVNALGEKHRLPVLLRYLHGLRNREIAQTLGVNEGTVRSRLHYACRKLSEQLSQTETVLKNPEKPV
jgi:RNA polymerase sigma-70 factor (ECF subfamily)